MEKIFTVSEFIEHLNAFFKAEEARITGEISELKRASSGHVYFTVKSKEGDGVLDAIVWKRTYELTGIALEVGMEVILSGHPNIYPPTGRFSFVADTVELVGEGALKKAYDALKRKLEAAGIFGPERKREIPEYVSRIGVVTSMKGAVIHDFENNLGKFGFVVNAIDSRVEGAQAVAPLVAAMARMRDEARKGNIEVLVIMRGGGSLESLQAFNNEALVREVTDFPVPVIAAIGHDQDVPLVALAADAMTSTPTAAAHLLSRSWELAHAKLAEVPRLFARIEEGIRRVRANLDVAIVSMLDHTEQGIGRIKERLAFAERALALNNPGRQLSLGYSITRHNGKIVKSSRGVASGEELRTELADGTIDSRVV